MVFLPMAQAASGDRPPELPRDGIVFLGDVSWADYKRVLEMRGDRPVPRLAFLEGVLELKSPSRPHESIKSMIGCLVEAWCLEKQVDISRTARGLMKTKRATRR